MNANEPIAIVGIGGRFPGAATLDHFWQHVSTGVDASRTVPTGRWAIAPEAIHRPGSPAPDAVYCTRGYYLDRIPEVAALNGLDPLFHLIHDVGQTAFADARMTAVDPSRVGVVLGNIALPTDGISAWARQVYADGPPTDPRNRYVTAMPAALLARSLGLGGVVFTLDAACASSLYALKLACDELRTGRMDAMLAGGAARPDCLYTQMGFAQLRALSPSGKCSPFDSAADGLVVGEGAGMFVLKRLTDAMRQNDHIYATIAGIGLSNDRDGNLLAPAQEGQLRAMQAAYRQAGWSPDSVGLIECHATGTPIGDAVEFHSLCEMWQGTKQGSTVIGSVKSTVGHLLTGAGAAALMKVLFALREQKLPPTANYRRPAPGIDIAASPFRILQKAEDWQSSSPRRAAISGFGFGGVNAHALIEEWTATRPSQAFVPSGVPHEPIAIVGLATQPGDWQQPLLHTESIAEAIREIEVPLDAFRIPPRELEEMLPQQLLALLTAKMALGDCTTATTGETGVFLGVTLDPNTTNFHLRWTVPPEQRDAVSPPLTANRTMGALASIAASRIARAFHFGGPSFTVSSEDTSGGTALMLGVRALQQHEISQAVVGAVDFATDPRSEGAAKSLGETRAVGDGSVCLVLKRRSDAERDGDRIYAIIDDVVATVGAPETDVTGDYLGGVTTLVEVVRATLSLFQQIIPGQPPRYWLMDGERRQCRVRTGSIDGSQSTIHLREHRPSRQTVHPTRQQSIQPITERIVVFRAGSTTELINAITRNQPDGVGSVVATMVVRTDADGRTQRDMLCEHLRERPQLPLRRDDLFYNPLPLKGEVAFIYPGSGNHFDGMGENLGVAFPQVLRRQQEENEFLRSQYTMDAEKSPKSLIFAQVALGTLTTDILREFGILPQAVLGYSLGESAGMFGMRVWTTRDEMLQRINRSTLFTHDLAPPYEAARRFWGVEDGEVVDWYTGIVPCSAEQVETALRPWERAYLLIVNTPTECYIGGQRRDVEKLVKRLGKPFLPIQGVTMAHCEVTTPIEQPYRELHTLPVNVPEGVRFYSATTGKDYPVTSESAAASILRGVQQTIDFPRLIEQAYADGVRIFMEPGPGGSCSRMIDVILGDRPHLCRAVCLPRQDNVKLLLRTLAALIAEGVAVDLSPLEPPVAPSAATGQLLRIPVGFTPRFEPVMQTPPAPPLPVEWDSPILAVTAAQSAVMDAHESYLRFSNQTMAHLQRTIELQTSLLAELGSDSVGVMQTNPPRSLDFQACSTFAGGRIGDVLGPLFADIDHYPTRVRLPVGPLMLVDEILDIEGEPLSLRSGRVVTTHHVHADRWYLDTRHIPTCVAVEAGQADLFLSGYLGIDFQTRGLACYRLLDAVVTFHGPLATIGETIHYDIHIDEFFRQGETYLFRFRFESTVNGRPLLTMRDGCAGFFTQEELAAGKGVIHTALDKRPQVGVRPDDWQTLAPLDEVGPLTTAQVESLRQGDLTAAFGPAFTALPLQNPQRLPGGMLRLVDRVVGLDYHAGRFGLGIIRAEADIHPDDWFLTCHFIDDQVMPGTLMYECCLHTLRIFLMRMGWIGEEGEVVSEPMPGVSSRLKCRGQVIASTKVVTYEVTIKELGYGPEPFAVADALMYADGKPIVEIGNLSIRLRGLNRERVEAMWASRSLVKRPLYDTDRITAFAIGNPSDAFGDRYRIFDDERVIARLPGPPFQFLDRITAIQGEPWKMVAGPIIDAEYDVPADAWYFAENRAPTMPFAVLLEIALQPCGWLAGYVGSALTSPVDVSFRNLGGKATQYESVGVDAGTLTTTVKLTRVSNSGGMIIQHYDFCVRRQGRKIYEGDTYFGFFSKEALATQIGIRDAAWSPHADCAIDTTRNLPHLAPFPDAKLRMVDTIPFYTRGSQSHGMGFVQGAIAVDPKAWFFQAHFFQDPVWPGSLGLESFLQLLKYTAHERWGAPPAEGWQSPALHQPHEWVYRGQVLPIDQVVTVQAVLTNVDDTHRRLTANGFLQVDGRVIYEMKGFTLQS